MYTNEQLHEQMQILKNADGRYNIDLVNSMLDMYIRLCMTFDKLPSVFGFSCLTGISQDSIYEWGNTRQYRNGFDKGLTDSHLTIIKKIRSSREESLISGLTSGKKNPVGFLAVLNKQFDWNTNGEVAEQKPTQQLTSREELDRIAMRNKPIPQLPNVD